MPETEDISKIEIRTEELEEILGRPPRSILRNGITVVSLIVITLLVGSWFFKYPDIVYSNSVVITTEYPPVKVVARMAGKIQNLLVADKQAVQKGQHLAVIENPANYQDVISLKSELDTLKGFEAPSDMALYNGLNTNLFLGDIQPYYAMFIKSLNNLKFFIKTDSKAQKLEAIAEEKSKYTDLYSRQSKQLDILSVDYTLSEKQFNRDSMLFVNGTLSNSEFEKAQATLLQKKYAFESMRITMANTKIQLSSLNSNALNIRLGMDEQGKNLEFELQQAFENLNGQIAEWEKNYVLKSSIDGLVTFTQFWSTDQFVNAGDEVMAVIPNNSDKLVAKMQLPVAGSGKVKEGQAVNIKLDNYPHMEYGMLRGYIKNISLVAAGDMFYVEVELPEGLTTNYHKKIKFVRQLQGTAEIITENRPLITRFVEPIKSILYKNQD